MEARPASLSDGDVEAAAARKLGAFERLAAFVALFRDAVPAPLLVTTAVLALLAGLTEGIGLALLAPLIGLLGAGGGSAGGIAGTASRALAHLGLPLTLTSLVSVFVVLVVVRTGVVGGRDIAVNRLRHDFVETLRRQVYDAISRAEWSFVAQERLSNLTKSLTSDVDRVGQGAYSFLQLPNSLVIAAIQVAVAVSFAPRLSMAALAVGVAIAVVARLRRGNVYRAGRRLVSAHRATFDEMSNFLATLKLSKSHNAEEQQRRAFVAALSRQRDQGLSYGRRNAEARMLSQVIGAIALGGFVYVGSSYAALSAPELVVMVVIFARLMPLIAQMQQNLLSVSYMLPVFDDLTALVARCRAAREATPTDGKSRLALRQAIRFEGVHFRYSKSADAPVLAGIDMAVPAGEVVALVGVSGAGKSTLADMMLGLLTPDAGKVLVDGEMLAGERLAAWRRSVAYVPQENFLLNDTVRANLLWGRPDASDGEIHDALALTGADAVVARMPDGIESPVGERGNQLSGGERQRIALARALLRRPTLLILDEATNALDNEGERALLAATERLRRTMTIVIIAHRLSSVRHADRIVVLDGGRVIQAGTWDALMAADEGRFAQLVRADAVAVRSVG